MTVKNLNIINNIQNEYFNNSLIKKLIKKNKKLEKKIFENINSENQTLNVLSRKYKFNFKIKELKKFLKFKTVAIIGMGGSILGSKSMYYMFKDKIKKKFYFFDDIDSKKISSFKKKEKMKDVLFIVVSKSGTTVETLSIFLDLKILKKNAKNIIIISEKKNNPLRTISKKFRLYFVEHKINIGGRYSVLSEVGIIPAYLMGLDVIKLRSTLLEFLKGKKKLFLMDSVVKLACLLKNNKIKNIIFLNYAPELEKFLFWCQQLIAESLGKRNKGFLPTISNVPKDHHSLLQLYLDGPQDKIFYIFSVKKYIKRKINTKGILENKEKFLNKKNLEDIKNAQKNALIKVFKNKKIPYRNFELRNVNELVLGELFSYFILETILIGKLIEINPYNQPAVELVKTMTKKLLN